jgi:hypothetical protein
MEALFLTRMSAAWLHSLRGQSNGDSGPHGPTDSWTGSCYRPMHLKPCLFEQIYQSLKCSILKSEQMCSF